MADITFEGFISLIKSIQLNLPKLQMPSLRIRDLLSRLPIVQGGMGVGISLSGLSSAVANHGGVGVIAANGIGMTEVDYFKDGRAANIKALRREIQKARTATKGIIGVNIMVALNDFYELLHTSIEEEVDLLILGAGLPVKDIPVKKMREHNVKVLPIVSSKRAAALIFRMWKKIYGDIPDGVIVEGPEAGGHLGVPEEEIADPAYKLETVIPEVTELLAPYREEFGRELPVIAAGGIFTGEDIYRMMKLGAQGVQMGTRFVATEECDADNAFKEAYVNAREEDIGIIKSPVGLPGRAIINTFLEDAKTKKQRFTCPWQCLAGCQAEKANFCISLALNNARRGKLTRGFVFAGSNAHRVESIVPVATLMEELEQGYLKALFGELNSRFSHVLERIASLRNEYQRAEKWFNQVREKYEGQVLTGIQSVRDKSVVSLRQEYRKAAAQITELRIAITDRISEGLSLLF
jgi:nitronate monooxygenase